MTHSGSLIFQENLQVDEYIKRGPRRPVYLNISSRAFFLFVIGSSSQAKFAESRARPPSSRSDSAVSIQCYSRTGEENKRSFITLEKGLYYAGGPGDEWGWSTENFQPWKACNFSNWIFRTLSVCCDERASRMCAPVWEHGLLFCENRVHLQTAQCTG